MSAIAANPATLAEHNTVKLKIELNLNKIHRLITTKALEQLAEESGIADHAPKASTAAMSAAVDASGLESLIGVSDTIDTSGFSSL